MDHTVWHVPSLSQASPVLHPSWHKTGGLQTSTQQFTHTGGRLIIHITGHINNACKGCLGLPSVKQTGCWLEASSERALNPVCVRARVCLSADGPAGRQWRDAAGGAAAEEKVPEADSWAAGHQAAPGRPAEPQPRAGEETEEVSVTPSQCYVHSFIIMTENSVNTFSQPQWKEQA